MPLKAHNNFVYIFFQNYEINCYLKHITGDYSVVSWWFTDGSEMIQIEGQEAFYSSGVSFG